MSRLKQSADVMLNGKPYMLARSSDHAGARSWQEQAPQSAEITSNQMPDVARGELGREVRVSWTTKHKGFGEPIRRVVGRDYYGRNIDKRYANQVTLARKLVTLTPSPTPGADPVGFQELGGALYVAYGRYLLSVDSSDVITTAEDFGVGKAITGFAKFKGLLYAALGESDAFQHSADGTTWTAHAGGFTATHFQVAENRLYRIFKNTGTVAAWLSNTEEDPTSSLNWSAADPIGDTSVPVTDMASIAYQIFIAKEDGLYAADIETGRFPSLTPELAAWRSTLNGRGVTGWGGLCFLPTVRGLKMFHAGNLYTAGPEVMSSNESDVKGRVTAMAGDANWLFAAMYNGTDTYILAGRNPRMDDGYPGEFMWNVVWYLSGGPYTAMGISGLNNDPRLWLARQGSLSYIRLGNNLDNPLQDTTADYHGSGTDYYPAHDCGSPMVDKQFLELRVYCENLSHTQGRHITWSYRLDDELTWTSLGKTQQSPVTVLKFDPAVDVVGRRIALRAVWAGGSDEEKAAVLRNVEVLAVEFPPNRRTVTAQFVLADNTQLRSGVDPRSALEILSDLHALVDARKVISMTDPLGRTYDVLPLGPVLMQEVQQTDTRPAILIATAQYLTV